MLSIVVALFVANPTVRQINSQFSNFVSIERNEEEIFELTWNSGGGSIGANGTFFNVLKFSALIPPSEQFSSESNCDTSASLSAANCKGKRTNGL